MPTKADWERKLEEHKVKPGDGIEPALLESMGVSASRSTHICTQLATGGVTTWGVLLALETEENLTKDLESEADKLRGKAIWNCVQAYKREAEATRSVSKRSRTHLKVVDFERVSLNIESGSEDRYVTLGGPVCEMLYGVASPLMLYRRPAVDLLFAQLKTKVLDEQACLFIYGPPGTGKSLSIFAFVCSQWTAEWTVSWFSCYRLNLLHRCRIDGKRIAKDVVFGDVEDYIYDIPFDKPHLVVLDGYLHGHHGQILGASRAWLSESTSMGNSRLVIATAMSSVDIRKHEADSVMLKDEKHPMVSWTKQEYLDAVKGDAFYRMVYSALTSRSGQVSSGFAGLDDEELSLDRRKHHVEDKFYYAGFSARYMFRFTSPAVREELQQAIAEVPSLSALFDGDMGDQAANVKNRLYARVPQQSPNGEVVKVTTDNYLSESFGMVVSEFAAKYLAGKVGPEKTSSWANNLRALRNPSILGWIFEMLFFSCLGSHAGAHLSEWSSDRSRIVEAHCWRSVEEPKPYEQGAFRPDDFQSYRAQWFKPVLWNQGTFDAFRMDYDETGQKMALTFVHCASGDDHDLRLDIIYSFMMDLNRMGLSIETKDLDVVFVIPRAKRENFKLNKVAGQGLLAPFGSVGSSKWKRGYEEQSIKLMTLDQPWME